MCPTCKSDEIHSWTEAYEKEEDLWCVFYVNECQECGHTWKGGDDCTDTSERVTGTLRIMSERYHV